jgi:hypothetical protein
MRALTPNVIGGLLMADKLFNHAPFSWWLVALPWIIGAVLGIIVNILVDD